MKQYLYQAAQLADDGSLEDVCHERSFEASDHEAAVITADAIHEVLKVAEHCNAIRVLDTLRNVIWSRLLEASEANG
jgi:hypothetical protein